MNMNPSTTKTKRPPRLKPGDTIGIVAPAGAFDRKIFRQGLSTLQSMGFQTRVPDEVFDKTRYLAGSDAQRARLVDQLFNDPDVQAIVCARGGFGCLRMLPLVDFDIIRTHPKIFVGYSDVTALLAAITRRSGLVTFHGPMVIPLATAPELTRRTLMAAIASDTPLEVTPAAGVVIQTGRAKGPVTGGNLTTLCHLLGTPFEAEYQNHIVLLEDRGEAHYRIDRMLSQMKLAGCFNGIAGLMLGSFEDCGALDGIYQIFQEHFQDFHIPILAGFNVGHGKQNMTIPLGMEATLDTDEQLLSFSQPATRG
jgi:muramoyltetrapeptide carboxypeptidase